MEALLPMVDFGTGESLNEAACGEGYPRLGALLAGAKATNP
jgi:hypothetical protein